MYLHSWDVVWLSLLTSWEQDWIVRDSANIISTSMNIIDACTYLITSKGSTSFKSISGTLWFSAILFLRIMSYSHSSPLHPDPSQSSTWFCLNNNVQTIYCIHNVNARMFYLCGLPGWSRILHASSTSRSTVIYFILPKR